jgi:hypothetical protein
MSGGSGCVLRITLHFPGNAVSVFAHSWDYFDNKNELAPDDHRTRFRLLFAETAGEMMEVSVVKDIPFALADRYIRNCKGKGKIFIDMTDENLLRVMREAEDRDEAQKAYRPGCNAAFEIVPENAKGKGYVRARQHG